MTTSLRTNSKTGKAKLETMGMSTMEMKNLLGLNTGYDRDTRRYLIYGLVLGLLILGVESWLFGARLLLLALGASISGMAVEVVFAKIRGKSITGGGLLNGVLLAALVPASTPLWMICIAAIIGTMFAQEAFGGASTCIFNPVLVSKAFLLVSYPSYNSLKIYTSAADTYAYAVHVVLGVLLLCVIVMVAFRPSIVPTYAGMALGAYLILAFAVGFGKLNEVTNLKDCIVGDGIDIRYVFLNDNWLLVAVLMAVAPCGTPKHWLGKIIIGLLLGVLGTLIRCFGRYPDSMVFATLICNTVAPTLDCLLKSKASSETKADGVEEVRS